MEDVKAVDEDWADLLDAAFEHVKDCHLGIEHFIHHDALPHVHLSLAVLAEWVAVSHHITEDV